MVTLSAALKRRTGFVGFFNKGKPVFSCTCTADEVPFLKKLKAADVAEFMNAPLSKKMVNLVTVEIH